MAYQLTKDNDGLVLFGYYPQTRKPKDVTITGAPNEFGVCSGSDGNRYLSKYGGYFRIEPIRWRVLKEKDGKLLLLSDMVLDYRPFDEGGTNAYLWSDISDWLDDEFFYDAFSPTERKMILSTTIHCDEESATPPPGVLPANVYEESWADAVDPQKAESFKDKVFLLSVRNATNEEFGFRDDPYALDRARLGRMTDYAATPAWAARGALSGVIPWWLRSPVPFCDYGIRVVDQGGCCAAWEEVDSDAGVRPAIRIKVE